MMGDDPGRRESAEEMLLLDEIAGRMVTSSQRRRVGAGPPADEEFEEVRARARKVLEKMRAGAPPHPGMEDMRRLSMAIGLPAPRCLFGALIEAASAGPKRKEAWRRRLDESLPVRETGGIRVDFLDKARGKMATAYLVLDACRPDHDLTAELEKLYSRIPPGRQAEIRKHLSMLVCLGRSVHALLAQKLAGALDEIGEKAPQVAVRELRVDPANTTLYIPGNARHRVGIHVRLVGEAGGI
jgi:hypothetical protein